MSKPVAVSTSTSLTLEVNEYADKVLAPSTAPIPKPNLSVTIVVTEVVKTVFTSAEFEEICTPTQTKGSSSVKSPMRTASTNATSATSSPAADNAISPVDMNDVRKILAVGTRVGEAVGKDKLFGTYEIRRDNLKGPGDHYTYPPSVNGVVYFPFNNKKLLGPYCVPLMHVGDAWIDVARTSLLPAMQTGAQMAYKSQYYADIAPPKTWLDWIYAGLGMKGMVASWQIPVRSVIAFLPDSYSTPFAPVFRRADHPEQRTFWVGTTEGNPMGSFKWSYSGVDTPEFRSTRETRLEQDFCFIATKKGGGDNAWAARVEMIPTAVYFAQQDIDKEEEADALRSNDQRFGTIEERALAVYGALRGRDMTTFTVRIMNEIFEFAGVPRNRDFRYLPTPLFTLTIRHLASAVLPSFKSDEVKSGSVKGSSAPTVTKVVAGANTVVTTFNSSDNRQYVPDFNSAEMSLIYPMIVKDGWSKQDILREVNKTRLFANRVTSSLLPQVRD